MLNEENLLKYDIKGLLDDFLQFEDKTLIFFDTETLGLVPSKAHHQLTQIGIISVDGNTMEEIKTLNMKIRLDDDIQQYINNTDDLHDRYNNLLIKYGMKTPEDLLKMTSYFENVPQRLFSEEHALKIFNQFIKNARNPILIAHNASFDMKFIILRGKRYGIDFNIKNNIKVIDTVKLARLYLIPVLQKLEKTDIIKKLQWFKEMYVKDIKPKTKKQKSNQKKDPNTHFEKYTDENGNEMLKIFYGFPSVSLGKLTPALIGDIENWHDALADVKSMIIIFKKIIEILNANRNLDIQKYQALAQKYIERLRKKYG